MNRSSDDSDDDSRKKKHNGKRYDKQFKIAAPKQAAASLGVHANTLQYWVRVYGTLPQEQAETLDTLRLRVKQLEKENQRLILEREILKKATAFFASQQP